MGEGVGEWHEVGTKTRPVEVGLPQQVPWAWSQSPFLRSGCELCGTRFRFHLMSTKGRQDIHTGKKASG